MTIRHLKIFITVAECGKMNLAAKKLYISQPSVSQAIQELENHYGIKLFERLSQKLYITEVGESLLPYAYHLVDSYEKIDAMLKHAGERPELRVGASISVGTCLLQPIVEKMEEDSQTKIQAFIHNTLMVEQMILNSTLDVGIVEGTVEHADVKQIPLCIDELVVVVGKKHPFYSRESIQLEELNNQKAAVRENGSQKRNQYEQLLEDNGISLSQKWNSTNTEAIKNIVSSGDELAILSRMLVRDEIRNGSLRIVPVENTVVEREIKLIFHKNKFLSKSLNQFITVSQDIISSMQDTSDI